MEEEELVRGVKEKKELEKDLFILYVVLGGSPRGVSVEQAIADISNTTVQTITKDWRPMLGGAHADNWSGVPRP